MKHQFFIGLDLGQAQDYTAISIVEVIPEKKGENVIKNFQIRYLHRFPLGTPYPDIVGSVKKIVDSLDRGEIVVDATGVGRPVVDLLKKEGIHPTEVLIHGGDSTTNTGSLWRVPKRDLVCTLTVAFQTGRLKIASALPEAKTLIDELLNFKVKINLKTAHDSYEAWREGQHDDLVLSVALACWAGNNNISLCLDEWEFY
jgi:hypothetical protein